MRYAHLTFPGGCSGSNGRCAALVLGIRISASLRWQINVVSLKVDESQPEPTELHILGLVQGNVRSQRWVLARLCAALRLAHDFGSHRRHVRTLRPGIPHPYSSAPLCSLWQHHPPCC